MAKQREPEFSVVVVNVRGSFKAPANFVYVGRQVGERWPGSPLGNPYHLPKEHTWQQRLEVVRQYEHWFVAQHDHWFATQDYSTPAGAEFRQLCELAMYPGRLALGCWCAPELCHAHVLQYHILAFCGGLHAQHLEQTVWAKQLAGERRLSAPREPVQMGLLPVQFA